MSHKNTMVKSRLLHSPGWDGCIEARLLRATDAWDDAPEFRSHGHVLRRLFEVIPDVDTPQIDAVVCVEGRPTVCIKDGTHLDDAAIEKIRQQLWNLGATTLLIVERPNRVEVFSTFSRPAENDNQGAGSQLNAETITQMESVALALRLRLNWFAE